MAEKLCIYCHKIVLDGFDEKERKYYEKGTKTLHTRERCESAKQGNLTQASQGNGQDLTNLSKKVDQVLLLLNEIHQRISGQGSLDVET